MQNFGDWMANILWIVVKHYNIYVNMNGNDSGEVKTVVVQAMECPVRGGSVVVPSDTLRQSITIKSSGPTDITVSQDSSKPALEITP